MPTYEYECKICGHTFEAFQAMSEEPLKSCPECGKEIRRLINGGTGVIFKGSGFYVTDKGKAGGGKTKSADAAPAPDKSPAASSPEPAAAKDGASPSADKSSGEGTGGTGASGSSTAASGGKAKTGTDKA